VLNIILAFRIRTLGLEVDAHHVLFKVILVLSFLSFIAWSVCIFNALTSSKNSREKVLWIAFLAFFWVVAIPVYAFWGAEKTGKRGVSPIK
jgi:hypothetical protein